MIFQIYFIFFYDCYILSKFTLNKKLFSKLYYLMLKRCHVNAFFIYLSFIYLIVFYLSINFKIDNLTIPLILIYAFSILFFVLRNSKKNKKFKEIAQNRETVLIYDIIDSANIIINELPAKILITDFSGFIIYANKKARNFLELQDSDLYHTKIEQIFPPERIFHILKIINDFKRGLINSFKEDIVLYTLSGEPFKASLAASLTLDTKNLNSHIIFMIENISDKSKEEDKKRFLFRLFKETVNKTRIKTVVFNSSYQIEYISDEMLKLFNSKKDMKNIDSILDLISDNKKEEFFRLKNKSLKNNKKNVNVDAYFKENFPDTHFEISFFSFETEKYTLIEGKDKERNDDIDYLLTVKQKKHALINTLIKLTLNFLSESSNEKKEEFFNLNNSVKNLDNMITFDKFIENIQNIASPDEYREQSFLINLSQELKNLEQFVKTILRNQTSVNFELPEDNFIIESNISSIIPILFNAMIFTSESTESIKNNLTISIKLITSENKDRFEIILKNNLFNIIEKEFDVLINMKDNHSIVKNFFPLEVYMSEYVKYKIFLERKDHELSLVFSFKPYRRRFIQNNIPVE